MEPSVFHRQQGLEVQQLFTSSRRTSIFLDIPVYRTGDVAQNPMVGAKPAKTKIPAVNMLTIRQHVVHLGTLRNSFTASTSLV